MKLKTCERNDFMNEALLFAALGYLSGSVLYAKVYPTLFRTSDASSSAQDQNPGAANAFQYGGFAYGVFVLLGDILKAFLPVFVYFHMIEGSENQPLSSLVLAAPVIGHMFPLFYHFKGGKGIASSFGSLLGIFPLWQPAVLLAALFLLFAVVIRIRPNYYLTMVVYMLMIPGSFLIRVPANILIGLLILCGAVLLRLSLSREERPVLEVSPVWKH